MANFEVKTLNLVSIPFNSGQVLNSPVLLNSK